MLVECISSGLVYLQMMVKDMREYHLSFLELRECASKIELKAKDALGYFCWLLLSNVLIFTQTLIAEFNLKLSQQGQEVSFGILSFLLKGEHFSQCSQH